MALFANDNTDLYIFVAYLFGVRIIKIRKHLFYLHIQKVVE